MGSKRLTDFVPGDTVLIRDTEEVGEILSFPQVDGGFIVARIKLQKSGDVCDKLLKELSMVFKLGNKVRRKDKRSERGVISLFCPSGGVKILYYNTHRTFKAKLSEIEMDR